MKVLTFNCWAIGYVPFMTKDRKQRVTAIAQYLAKGILILESFFTLTHLLTVYLILLQTPVKNYVVKWP